MAPPAGDPTSMRMDVCACAPLAASATVNITAVSVACGVRRRMASSLILRLEQVVGCLVGNGLAGAQAVDRHAAILSKKKTNISELENEANNAQKEGTA